MTSAIKGQVSDGAAGIVHERSTDSPRAGLAATARRLRLTPSMAGAAAPGAIAIAYFLAAKLGEALAFPSAPVSALWAPNAILFAGLLLAPVRRWWIYLLSVLPLHLAAQLPGFPLGQVVIQYICNSAEAALGAACLLWLEDRPQRFDSLSTMANLIVMGSIGASLVTSIVMAGAFIALGLTGDFWLTTAARTVTNAFATIALVPLISLVVLGIAEGRFRPSWRRVVEALLIAACLLAVGALVFVLHREYEQRFIGWLFAPIPLLLWATVRFGVLGACGSMLLVGALATWGIHLDMGSSSHSSPAADALALVIFLNVTGAPLLLLAAVLRERADTAAALARSEALHSSVLVSLQDQIAVLDQDGNIIEANDSWKQAPHRLLLTDEQPGRNYLSVVTRAASFGDETSAAICDALRAVLSGSIARRELEFSLQQPDGTHWFEQSIEALRRAERGAVVTLSDVTARKRAELEVHEQQQQLAHLTRAAIVGEFSGALAHEIKQPLAAILGNAEAAAMLLAEEDEGVDPIREILNDIIADDLRAAQVINRLPSMLRNADAQRGPLALDQLVQESLVLARGDLARHRVSVITEFETNLPHASGDRVLIQQVILNLISNACDAMSDVPVEERRLILSTRYLRKLQRVEVIVRDHGRGIPDNLHERIFQPFITSKPNGLGLGLSICRSIIDAHGGRLWAVQASPGAAFHFMLPVQP